MRTSSSKDIHSPLFRVLGNHFPILDNWEIKRSVCIPLHRSSRSLTAPHPKYPYFGRAVVADKIPVEKYKNHYIFRSPILPVPWFAGVIHTPGDTFHYPPINNSGTTVLPTMFFSCQEGTWFVKVQLDTLENIKRELSRLPLDPLENPHNPPPGGKYFEPKALS